MKTMMAAGAALLMVMAGACAEAPEDDLENLDLEPAAEEMAPSGTAPATNAAEASSALRVDTLTGTGAYLTDAQGRALYLLEGEPTGQTTCTEACAQAWPPFVAAQPPAAAATPVQAGLIGSFARPDGAMQVTYNGHALYYYQKDEGPGQATGQDVTDEWGEWYLVTPKGEPLEDHANGAETH